ncbi:hypothetical protein PSI23_16390 [Xenorhabdus sp. XENO-10]|uniref:Uncharacterized protein n=1 Tax=Xenorhabdus yunnanensis TaxID=3025878 RepID=A0ABT5LK42_9GAMM|nr:hypothetical protein [Xenorhabdus yunnanensis]MDC9590821.1 hypothetical protein [Xenorhabdus yunnanensis]
MGLDIHITTTDNEVIHIVMSEDLHGSIFYTPETRWSSAKNLRKMKDYYEAYCVFEGEAAISFLEELSEMENRIIDGKNELHEIFEKVKGKKISCIRITGD